MRPAAPSLRAVELVLLADCAAADYPTLHDRILFRRVVAMGCPKLDDLEAHIDRLAVLLAEGVVALVVPAVHYVGWALHQGVLRCGAFLLADLHHVFAFQDVEEHVHR